ncbi:hypothetical protein BJL95_13100 [Methylomonas sp. LWB]|nr:hypothetical protein BJL95_13100 [Methylomonas sp. LWB]
MREVLDKIETSEISGKPGQSGIARPIRGSECANHGAIILSYWRRVKRFSLIAKSFKVLKVLLVLDGKTLILLI